MCNKIIIMRWKLFRCDLESAANSVKGVVLRAPKAENACEFQLAPGDSTVLEYRDMHVRVSYVQG